VKPPAFQYERPRSVDEALSLLAEHGDEAKVLAGGQSLVPMLNMRLARPEYLIDIGRLGALSHIVKRDGILRIGALARQVMLERSQVAAQDWPLLVEAVRLVAHPAIRSMGTVGGSVAHADPAAELPVTCVALDAQLTVRSTKGERRFAAEDFFVTHLTTAMEPDELLVEMEFPAPPSRSGSAFVEFTRRHGDFALGGAAAVVALDDDGVCKQARLVLMSAAPVPWRAHTAEAALTGQRLDRGVLAEAARRSVDEVEPTGDIHGSAEYRKHLVETMARRALESAHARARAELAED
jgi:CO/xanthine dehydrogenase FAD-binding subunit